MDSSVRSSACLHFKRCYAVLLDEVRNAQIAEERRSTLGLLDTARFGSRDHPQFRTSVARKLQFQKFENLLFRPQLGSTKQENYRDHRPLCY